MYICSGCIYKNRKLCRMRDCTCLRKYKTFPEQFGICEQVTMNGAERVLHILLQCEYCLTLSY